MNTLSFSQNGQKNYPYQISSDEFVIDINLVKKLNYFKTDCDFFKVDLETSKKLILQLEQKSNIQDTIILTQKKELTLFKDLVDSKQEQIGIYKKELKIQKEKNFGNKLLLYGSLLLSGYLIIK
jgi:putative ubiquitin-RnfH superfamily antitoxin RatB of RatAB toxin-antitoxin module